MAYTKLVREMVQFCLSHSVAGVHIFRKCEVIFHETEMEVPLDFRTLFYNFLVGNKV